jgi:hypothetical protein
MIITKQKPIEDLLSSLGKGPVFIIGCNECATLCHTGGEKELEDMKKILEENDILITGMVILEPACHLNNDKRILKFHKKKLDKSKKILVLACGNGVQTVSEIFEDKEIISGTNTLFLGEIKRSTEFDKRCNLCGECLLDLFAGFCPVSRCPKSMLNGPCGGSKDRKCEVEPHLECIWILAYERLKKRGKLELFDEICEPKDWSKSLEMRRQI